MLSDITYANLLSHRDRHGTPAVAARQHTSLVEAELPATAADSTLLHQASIQLPRLARTATNLHLAARTRAMDSPKRQPRTRPKPRAVTTVPGTTRASEAKSFWLFVLHARGRFNRVTSCLGATSSEFLGFSLFPFDLKRN